MKLTRHIYILFFIWPMLGYTQSSDCVTELLGSYNVLYGNIQTNTLLFQGKNCLQNQFAIQAKKNGIELLLIKQDSVNFANCRTGIDTLLWLYYYVHTNKFNDSLIKTSKPYSRKENKQRIYFYYSVFYLENIEWVTKFSLCDNIIEQIDFSIDEHIPTKPLLLIGSITKKSN
jgi:hypothetical protein